MILDLDLIQLSSKSPATGYHNIKSKFRVFKMSLQMAKQRKYPVKIILFGTHELLTYLFFTYHSIFGCYRDVRQVNPNAAVVVTLVVNSKNILLI